MRFRSTVLNASGHPGEDDTRPDPDSGRSQQGGKSRWIASGGFGDGAASWRRSRSAPKASNMGTRFMATQKPNSQWNQGADRLPIDEREPS